MHAPEANAEQRVTPWEVEGEVVGGVQQGIDYEKLMRQFGCAPLDGTLIERFERVTGRRAHPLLRRGLFYCHRDFDRILELHEQGKPFYLYTGRGPSSESMHLGHMVPFLFCQFLQSAFKCPIVIQLTDDEKFLFKEKLTLSEVKRYAADNARDIIAAGFDPERTFIFANTAYMGRMFELVLSIQKLINVNQAKAVFGFEDSDAIGRVAFPAMQIAPCFPAAFPHLFGGERQVPCLIPYAIDQDPYFRLCRDIAPRLGFLKPASLCSAFFPALQGSRTKMSASAENTAIFMSDTPAQIAHKITRYAFSGGADTMAEHRARGANVDVDVAYQYLRFFHDDDADLEHIRVEYAAGRMTTGEVKARCTQVLCELVGAFQARRAAITDEDVRKFTRMPALEGDKACCALPHGLQ